MQEGYEPYTTYAKGTATSVTIDGDQVWVTVDGDSKTKKKYDASMVLLDNDENKLLLDLQESKRVELTMMENEKKAESDMIEIKFKPKLDEIRQVMNTQKPVSVKMFNEKIKTVAKELLKEVK